MWCCLLIYSFQFSFWNPVMRINWIHLVVWMCLECQYFVMKNLFPCSQFCLHVYWLNHLMVVFLAQHFHNFLDFDYFHLENYWCQDCCNLFHLKNSSNLIFISICSQQLKCCAVSYMHFWSKLQHKASLAFRNCFLNSKFSTCMYSNTCSVGPEPTCCFRH